jgi:hypothetical protein
LVNILEKTYETYKMQIEEIVRACKGNKTRAGEIIAWFYGTGTPESWRKFLEKVSIKAPKSKVISEFLASLAERKKVK